MVELRFHQRTMWEGWFPEEASGWWEEWMKQADQVLDDEELLDSVYEAQGRRWPKSRRRGLRKRSPATPRRPALGRPASSTLPTTPTLLRETIPPTSSVGGIAVQPSARLSVAVGFLSFILRCNCSRFSAAIAQASSQNSFHAACAWRASSTCLAGTYNARFFPSL